MASLTQLFFMYVILNVGQTLMVFQENISLCEIKCMEVSGVKLAVMNYSHTVEVRHKSWGHRKSLPTENELYRAITLTLTTPAGIF